MIQTTQKYKYLSIFVLRIAKIFIFPLLFLLLSIPANSQKVGLVMSGGGAKGLMHIGVIKALEENNIPIDYVAGTSMGAIIGGLYSIGYTTDEMIALLSSPDFEKWYKGTIPSHYNSRYYDLYQSPSFITFRFDLKGGTLKQHLPTHLISPYQMDLALVKIFAQGSAVAQNNFDELFVPFRCVASNISAHEPHIFRSGDLGTAVRASMSFPFVFKPVTLDSMLLFDGGIYNNFPWNIMRRDFAPDLIIGSKCVSNYDKPEEDDIVSQIQSMIATDTNYDLPESIGILIEEKYPEIGLLDFNKIDAIVQTGYDATMKKIAELKERSPRTVTPKEVEAKRNKFKGKMPPLEFKDIDIVGLNEEQNKYVERMIGGKKGTTFNFDQLTDKFFTMVTTSNVNTFIPTASIDSTGDYFNVRMKASSTSPFKVMLGGNISSSSVNQGFIGLEYRLWKRSLTRLSANVYFGRLYTSFLGGVRQDIASRTPFYYDAFISYNMFDYYKGSPDLFFKSLKPSYIKEYDFFVSSSIGAKVTRNYKLSLGFSSGNVEYQYYRDINYVNTDRPDKTKFPYFTGRLRYEKNTLNFIQYPTAGQQLTIGATVVTGKEKFRPRVLSSSFEEHEDDNHLWGAGRFLFQTYFPVVSGFRLGLYTDWVVSSRIEFNNYTSTLLVAPAFRPTPHSQFMYLEEFRADSYAAFGIIPSYHFTPKLYLRADAYFFIPYKPLERTPDNKIMYGKNFNGSSFMGSAAAVFQFPFGPMSASVNYYQNHTQKFYFMFSIGFTLFNHRGIEY